MPLREFVTTHLNKEEEGKQGETGRYADGDRERDRETYGDSASRLKGVRCQKKHEPLHWTLLPNAGHSLGL